VPFRRALFLWLRGGNTDGESRCTRISTEKSRIKTDQTQCRQLRLTCLYPSPSVKIRVTVRVPTVDFSTPL
jgi:hypothetical protein